MTGVISKWFINGATEFPGGGKSYSLGVVCRGEENRHWAAATPSGSATIKGANEVLAAAFAGDAPHEVTMTLRPDPEGEWVMDECKFTYGGCQVHFRQKETPWGELTMTVNASDATMVLRKAYAESLIEGEPKRFAMTIDKP